jgi:glycosyltransferase involved in cell wall biosynthesis
MKISGFTFVRNAVKYDYPVVEAITSILPLCDEFVVCLGNSDDDTEQLIKSIASDKIKIVPSVWDDSLRKGGQVLAVETNKALDALAPDSDWAFYIQADEVVHEKYLPIIRQAMEQHLDNKKVDCLVLKYLHFYGNYNYVGDSRKWYRREIRVIRAHDKTIRSYRDAQGFRRIAKVLKSVNGGGQVVDNQQLMQTNYLAPSRKLNGKLIDAYVYHYGWVRNPYKQQAKMRDFNKLWHSDEYVAAVIPQEDLFDYSKINSLRLFDGTHPQVMQERISAMTWDFEFDERKRHFSPKERVLNWIERAIGKRLFEFRNYKLI